MSNTPTQVRERAQAIMDDLRAQQEGPGQGETPADIPKDAAPAASVPESHPEQPAPQPVTDEPKVRNDWKKRFEGLRNARDEKAAKLQAELEAANRKLVDAELALAEASKKPLEVSDFIDDESREILGDEATNAMFQMAEKMSDAKAEALQKQLNDLMVQRQAEKEDRAKQVQATEFESFQDKVRSAIPNMADIEKDQRFFDWLDEVEPMSGMQKRELANRAVASRDVARVVGFYNSFLETLKDPREALVTPKPSNAAPSQTQQAKQGTKKIWSVAEVQAAMRKAREAGQTDEANRIRNEIMAAQAEGRIR